MFWIFGSNNLGDLRWGVATSTLWDEENFPRLTHWDGGTIPKCPVHITTVVDEQKTSTSFRKKKKNVHVLRCFLDQKPLSTHSTERSLFGLLGISTSLYMSWFSNCGDMCLDKSTSLNVKRTNDVLLDTIKDRPLNKVISF